MLQAINAYCLNEVGGRDQNEDSVWPDKYQADINTRLFMVCDGVGGSSQGEVASRLCTEGFAEYFEKHLLAGQKPNTSFVEMARQFAMMRFKHYIESHPQAESMSTTLTLAYLNEKSIFIAWCGDSRIYQIRDGQIVYQSEDHSLLNEMIRRGELSPEDAQSFSNKNIILRALQYRKPYSAIETAELTDIRTGDYLLLCSDGLLENITPQVIKQILGSRQKKDPTELFHQYCYRQTKDNYSMYLIELGGKAFTGMKSIGKKKYVPILLAGLAGLCISPLMNWTSNLFEPHEQTNPKPASPIEQEHNNAVVNTASPSKENREMNNPVSSKSSGASTYKIENIAKDHRKDTKRDSLIIQRNKVSSSTMQKQNDTPNNNHGHETNAITRKRVDWPDSNKLQETKLGKIKEDVKKERISDAKEHPDVKKESIEKQVESYKRDSTFLN
ncbi:protein phosphatase 2C domain-containing protein [Chitinophagaceae bacterium LB-8]|uniref:Protein phosphatase 2C domain-containing protein n=1 Tax=Paraflavisolibacter caeni TaxID=2982496 RepID=A0A9X3B7Y9_9BACT|nr:protein phosphatase 2C domain-containing protein [Paraflavisolibacter caeni]MCU7549845.1 protein phosphatase 2C domain-containing protein [Paraflavisolibacter caeni]